MRISDWSSDVCSSDVLSGLKVSDSSGLNFTHVEFSLDPANKYFPITIGSSSDIDTSHMYVHGLLDGDPSNDAMAMNIWNSSNISVTESEFEDLHHAINFLDSDHVTVSGNSFHTMRSDGVRGGGTNDVVISNNYFTDFHPVGADQIGRASCRERVRQYV